MKLIIFVVLALSISSIAEAGRMNKEQAFTLISNKPKSALALITLLEEKNLKKEACDIQFYRSKPAELLCNTTDDGVIAVSNILSNEEYKIEYRPNQQVKPGINPVKD